MEKAIRKTGIDIIGDVPWGAHLCLFYQTKKDLIDYLVPYFEAGLENNELCVWVASDHLTISEAKAALSGRVKKFNDYIQRGQIEILDVSQCYTKSGEFEADKVLQGWVEKEREAIKKGFEGLRITAHTFGLEKRDWKSFAAYEKEVDRTFGGYRIIAICTYPLDKCGAHEVIDAISSHRFAFMRREGRGEIIAGGERERLAEELRERRGRYRDLVESVEDWVWEVNADGVYTYSSPRVRDILGYEPGDLLGKKVFDIMPPEEAKRVGGILRERAAARKAVLSLENTNIHKDGHLVILETSARPFFTADGTLAGYRGVGRDITDRKKEEKAIEESEKRFKTIFENAIDGMLLADPESKKLIMGNKTICEMLGYSPDEIKNIGVEDIHPREYLPYVIEQFEKQAKRDITISKNLPMKRRDGSVFYADVGASPMVLEGKQYLLGIFRDITERRKAEEALRNEEERFRIVVETSYELVYEWDMKHSIQWFGKIDEMLGYSPGEFPRTLDAWKDSIHPEDRERVMAAVQAYLDGHAPYNIEYRIRTKNGAFRWWAARGAVARATDGHPVRWIGTLADITARKKMEERLVETARQLQAILDNIPDIAWLKDRKSRFIAANEAFGKVCGVRPGDLVGKTDLDIWPRELAERYRHDDQEVMKSGIRKRVEEPLTDKDGTVRWIETIKSLVFDEKGEIVGTVGIARDITESRLAREKIENAAEQWRNTFDSISDMISIHDLSCRITRVNRAFASAFGMEPQELIGRTCHELFHETKEPHAICPGKEAIERGETVGTEFFEPRMGRYLEVVAAPFRDENDAITGFVHIAKDVTEKKEAEAKELQSEKLAVVGELASGVAHEIRNPLANISATAQYVLGKYELDKALRKHMDVIVRNSESANRIIMDLLNLAKPYWASLRMCSMREVVKKTCELIRPRCAVNRVRIKRRLERRLPSVLMEPDRMEQALMNFMLNAVDAMPQGGILAITAESDPGKNKIVVSIADTGKGIPKKELPKIFNPFFSTKRDGVGLGLSLARQIIDQHNGAIDVQSEVGQGTTVTVRLPTPSKKHLLKRMKRI